MAGAIKKMLDQIIAVRSRGDPTFAMGTTTKLILKGLDPARFTADSPDDPAIIAKVRQAAADLGITLN